jgi:hypothetical protein
LFVGIWDEVARIEFPLPEETEAVSLVFLLFLLTKRRAASKVLPSFSGMSNELPLSEASAAVVVIEIVLAVGLLPVSCSECHSSIYQTGLCHV